MIACGHYCMAINSQATFFAGLILIACGTGLLKPNISAMVGQLYSEDDKRRDAGFSIFYMGINLGAFLSPIVVGFLAQHPWFRNFISSVGFDPNSAWHWGFGAAGVGMTLGIIQYVLGQKRLDGVGDKPDITRAAESERGGIDYRYVGPCYCRRSWRSGSWDMSSAKRAPCQRCSQRRRLFCRLSAGHIRRLLSGDELKRVLVIFFLFLFSILFWMTYEQAGSSLTLFADRLTHTTISRVGLSFELVSIGARDFRDHSCADCRRVWQKLGIDSPPVPASSRSDCFLPALLLS